MCAEQLAVARLPVRAVVPARVQYSGRKTTEQQIDSAYASKKYDKFNSMGGGYAQNNKGDSIYVIHPGGERDTINP